MTKEEKLLIETRNKMQRLYEYSFFNHGVFEDGEQNDPMGGGAPSADPMAGGAPGADPMGGADPMAGGAPGADPMGGGAPGADPMGGGAPGADPMGGAPGADPMGGDPMGGGAPGADPMGGDPTGQDSLAPNAGMDGDPNAMGADPNMMGDPMGGDMGAQPGPNDDVVDISQLTDAQDELQAAQEETAEQLQGVDDKLTTLMKVVDKFTKALDANDQKINDLKHELIKKELQLRRKL